MRPSRSPKLTLTLSLATLATAALAAGCTVTAFGPPIPGGEGGTAPVPTTCGETPACPRAQECLAIAGNHGAPQFGMRIAELTMSSPAVLSPGGLLGFYLQESFNPSLPACFGADTFENGAGTTSWLLRFDLQQGTLTVGGAAPPADPTKGYTLLDAMVPQDGTTYAVAPVTFDLATSHDGSLGTVAPHDVLLPMFFPTTPVSGPVVLPLHSLSATGVIVSPTHDCIGRYDPAIFDPNAGCSPSTTQGMYEHAGHLTAYVSLEEADTIDMGALQQTLCVTLSGDVTRFGDGAMPVTHCKRTNGAIDFQGDWCSSTNGPATATCADAVRFAADFAASAVVIHD